MRTAFVASLLVGLSLAGAASAQNAVSDQAFLRANRCVGIARGLGADASALKSFVHAQSRSRAELIIYKGQGQAGEAEHQARNPANREKLRSELSGPCSAFADQARAADAPAFAESSKDATTGKTQ